MPDTKDVTLDSSTANGGDQPSTAGGKQQQETAEQLASRLRLENERKQSEIVTLRSEKQEVLSELAELREIKRQYGELTAREQARLDQLKKEKSDIDSQIDELKAKPEAKPWFTHLERELARVSKTNVDTAINAAAVERAADLLDELAEDLSGDKEFEGMTDDKLLKLIKPYMGQFETKSPYRKTKLAFKAWKEDYSFKKEKSEASKKKAEESLSPENGGRAARESSAQDLISKRGDLSGNERAVLREKLGIIQRSK